MTVYLLCYATAFLFARSGHHFLAGTVLMLSALYLYWQDYRRWGSLIHLRGLFSLFWIGGQGVSCLKLSRLQAPWSGTTWVCFLLAYLGFWVTFELLQRRFGTKRVSGMPVRKNQDMAEPLFHSIVAITVISLAAFLLEAAVLGYIPLLVRGVPHAYSEFHLSGVHYFTVSCVLVPGLSVLYFWCGGSRRTWKNWMVTGAALVSVLIPLLCVSRFQLVFAMILAVFTYGAVRRKLSLWYLAGIFVVLVPLYVLLTVARSHDVAYLNGIFEMKNSNMPIFISQPYIYIANNYDNFNCLTEQLPAHTWGIRMLFPLWALTGLKFRFPELTGFPLYLTKTELTTVTLFYDAYYDFGILGVLLFSCLLGAVSWYLVQRLEKLKNPAGYLLYAQFAMYMVLSFFTTWFSNPTTWFYFFVTGAVILYCEWKGY